MNKPWTIVSTFVVAALIGTLVWQLQDLVIEVQQRFPDIDPKIVEKAYYTMLRKSLTGQYDQNLSEYNDAQMDQLIMIEIDRLSHN